MIPLYFWSVDLNQDQNAQAGAWVRRFSEFLAAPAYGISCLVRPVDERLASVLNPALAEADVASVAVAAIEILVDDIALQSPDDVGVCPKLVIFCPEGSDLTAKVRASNPNALWGGSLGCFAVVNRHEPTVAWHELFHLFGAKDCYDENNPYEAGPPLCGNPNCLMQYAPSLEAVGDPPFLCDANVQRVRKRYFWTATEES